MRCNLSFFQCMTNERLSSEAWIDGHNQNKIDFVDNIL